jgi:hypothetical protein
MKIANPIPLAVIAAFAAMGLIGASSASATTTHKVIQLCKAQELLLCAAGNLIKHPLKGRLLLTLAGGAEFNSVFTVKCPTGSGSSAEFEGFGNDKIDTKLEKLVFSNCEGGCAEVFFKESQPETLGMSTELGEDWFLAMTPALVTFSKCTFGVTCAYEGNLKLNVKMNAAESFFEPEGATLKLHVGSQLLCGSTLTWNKGKTKLSWRLDDGVKQADGTLGTPDAVWPTLLEKLTTAS